MVGEKRLDWEQVSDIAEAGTEGRVGMNPDAWAEQFGGKPDVAKALNANTVVISYKRSGKMNLRKKK